VRQTEDWNCGAFALRHILERLNIRISGERLDMMLDPNPDKTIGAIKGVSHEDMYRVLGELNIKFVFQENSSLAKLRKHLPAVVNFQRESNGHYGVAETWNGGLIIWDPWTGGNLWYSAEDFSRDWYSTLYGTHWWLHIFLDQETPID